MQACQGRSGVSKGSTQGPVDFRGWLRALGSEVEILCSLTIGRDWTWFLPPAHVLQCPGVKVEFSPHGSFFGAPAAQVMGCVCICVRACAHADIQPFSTHHQGWFFRGAQHISHWLSTELLSFLHLIYMKRIERRLCKGCRLHKS